MEKFEVFCKQNGKNKDLRYNLIKCMEELGELSQVIIKNEESLTEKLVNDQCIEEMGDLLFCLEMVAENLGFSLTTVINYQVEKVSKKALFSLDEGDLSAQLHFIGTPLDSL